MARETKSSKSDAPRAPGPGEWVYVRGVVGHVVPRFGAVGAYVGAQRVRGDDGAFTWEWRGTVVALPQAEWNRYRKEYMRALRDGSLVHATAAEWAREQQQPDAAAPAEEG